MLVIGKGWAPQQARACGFYFNRILCFTKTHAYWGRSGAITAHCVFYAPPGANLSTTQVGIRADSFYSPSTSACAHEVGHPHTYTKPHIWKHFTSFNNISDLSFVRCFVPKSKIFPFLKDLLHRQLVVADRLLEPLVLDLNVLCFSQANSAYYGQCRTRVNVQSNRDDSTQVFGKRLNSHRLCCCTVASEQLCFGGALGDDALLLRTSLDQVLPVQDHGPIRVSKGVQGTWMSLPFKQTPNPWPSNEEPSPLSSCSSSLVRPAETSLSTASWWRM